MRFGVLAFVGEGLAGEQGEGKQGKGDGGLAHGGSLRDRPYMDAPEETKDGLRSAYRSLAALDFRHLLLAHGEPFVADGREALAAFAGRD